MAPTAFGAAAVVAACGVGFYLLQDRSDGSESDTSSTIDLSLGECGAPSRPVSAGPAVFAIHNTSSRPVTVHLADDDSAVYAELEDVGPGVTRPLQVPLGSGAYHFVCLFTERVARNGARFTVAGDVPRGPAARALSVQDLTPATLAYQRWITDRLPRLRTGVAAVETAGDVDSARRAWTDAHHLYETLGAAYGAFGDWDARINGDDGGFARLQAALWGRSPHLDATAAVDLTAAVDGLIADSGALAVAPLDIGLRAHEIIENTIEHTLSGDDDLGAHAALNTADANLIGTRTLLDVLDPLLHERYPELPRTRAALDRARAVTADLAARHGGVALADLPRADRDRLNAAFGELVERLAPVAVITDVRRTR
ncbi:EfeM/EfeO family lipoprotein [Gordonia humi]|uniref:hypothetical protein n=1 Tax=Gordonia humi TaxID=686429 RepID=UPI00337C305B